MAAAFLAGAFFAAVFATGDFTAGDVLSGALLEPNVNNAGTGKIVIGLVTTKGSTKGGTIAFRGNAFANPLALVKLINEQSGMKVRPDQKIVLTRDWPTPQARLVGVKALLAHLAKLAQAA